MTRTVDKLILVPRYTTLVGAYDDDATTWLDYHTAPMNVAAYESADVSFAGGPLLGSGAAVSVSFDVSTDLIRWDQIQTSGSIADTEQSDVLDLNFEWLRVRIALTGTPGGDDPAITLWGVGNFLRREGL